MSILGGLFQPKQDPLNNKAKKLVYYANINAINLYAPLSKEFQILGVIDINDFDFFTTIAGVFIGASSLWDLDINDERQEKLTDIISESLENWNRNSIRVFTDCEKFYLSRYNAIKNESQFVASDVIGSWIVWNVLRKKPESEEELSLIRVVGGAVVHSFGDWWNPDLKLPIN